jgi:hypothetical protein
MSYMAKTARTKVHLVVDGRPLCGGGNGAKTVRVWQSDIGPANCVACLIISAKRAAKAVQEVGK